MRNIILIFSLFVLQGLYSQGIYESYIILDVNGGGNTYYDLNADTGNPNFNGNNLGVFSTGNTLYLKGFEHKVWVGQNGCSFASSRLFYKVEESSYDSQTFSMLEGSNSAYLGGNNHKWDNQSEMLIC